MVLLHGVVACMLHGIVRGTVVVVLHGYCLEFGAITHPRDLDAATLVQVVEIRRGGTSQFIVHPHLVVTALQQLQPPNRIENLCMDAGQRDA